MRYLSLILIFLTYVITFPISQRAIEYYSAAELSYKSGDYGTALRNYELALTTDPTIEGYDSYIKFKMGISAYMIGNYDKARSYLSGYNTSFVKELLASIDKRQSQDEWKRWISKNKLVVSEVSTQTFSKVTKVKSTNLILPIVIFLVIFLSLIVAEIRILRLRKQVLELPLRPEKEKLSEVREEIIQVKEKSTKEAPVEDEIMQLIPENAKIVDFEKLINSEIDIFKDLLDGTGGVEDILFQEKEYKGQETQKDVSIAEETSKERKNIIENILEESKELIQSLKIEESEQSSPVHMIELSELESKFIEKLKDYSKILSSQNEIEAPRNEIDIEDLEKLQQDFTYFDSLEKITEEDTKLLVKKLVDMYRGENS